jgi:hypothetical protein
LVLTEYLDVGYSVRGRLFLKKLELMCKLDRTLGKASQQFNNAVHPESEDIIDSPNNSRRGVAA